MSDINAIEKLRESLKDCTNEAGVEPNRFDTYWITAKACDILIDEVEAEIAERYTLLPVDAEGVPIHIGDYLQLGESRGHVIALTYCPCNELPWEWQCDSDGDWYNTKFAHHAKPRTLEDVLRDVMTDFADADFNDETIEIITARYIGELRELMEGDAE